MKRAMVMVMAVATLVIAWGVGPALGWQCPVQWKAAEEAIKKAESMNVPAEAKVMLEDAKRLIAEAKKHHTEGNTKVEHARSMYKAKSALAIGESVITISQP